MGAAIWAKRTRPYPFVLLGCRLRDDDNDNMEFSCAEHEQSEFEQDVLAA